MPEPDPLTDALVRFTPVPGFDRDALLFEAGRRSARPSRLLHVGAALLALANVVLLVVAWPRDHEPPALAPAASPAIEFVIPPASPPADGWTVRSSPDVLASPPPSMDGEFIRVGPPLTARSALVID
jgi:hypothetical protein